MKLALAFALLTFCVHQASASVAGTLNMGDSGTISVTLHSITWNADPSAKPAAGPPWNMDVATTTTLSLAGCGSVLASGGAGCGVAQEGVNVAPLDLFLPTPTPFLTFECSVNIACGAASHVTLTASLTSVGPGSGNSNCQTVVSSGQSCSVFGGSPILLTLSGTSATIASLPIFGIFDDGTTPKSTYVGAFSATIAGVTPAQLQLFFCPDFVANGNTCTAAEIHSNTAYNAGGASQPVSAQIVVTALPEPGSISLALLGMAGIAAGIRRRKRQG